MTAKHIFDSALLNLGYRKTDRLYEPALTFINQVCGDLSTLRGDEYHPLASLSDAIPYDDAAFMQAAVYGLSMHLALLMGDGDKNQFFANIYTQKRRLLATTTTRVDSLPRGED